MKIEKNHIKVLEFWKQIKKLFIHIKTKQKHPTSVSIE
jgi:hypothetical protein